MVMMVKMKRFIVMKNMMIKMNKHLVLILLLRWSMPLQIIKIVTIILLSLILTSNVITLKWIQTMKAQNKKLRFLDNMNNFANIKDSYFSMTNSMELSSHFVVYSFKWGN